MLFVSFNLSPSEPELVNLSEPAKSMRFRVATVAWREGMEEAHYTLQCAHLNTTLYNFSLC